MKKNWFWGILIVIILSWIGNIVYFEVHQLDEPIVLDTYIDIQSSDYTNFSLFYLTNSSEVVELEALIAGGYTYNNEQNFFPWFGDVSAQSYKQQFTHQFLKEAYFTFDEQSLNGLVKGFQDNDLYARFTNGQVVPIELKKLNVRTSASENNFLSSKVTFVSTQGVQGNLLEVTENVEMDQIVLPDSILNQVELKVLLLSDSTEFHKLTNKDWEDIEAPLYNHMKWPLEIQKGNSVGLFLKIQDSNTYVYMMNDWSGITESKEIFTYTSPLLIEPHLSNQDVVNIVQKARGEQR